MNIQEFNRNFPDNKACLAFLFVKRFGEPVCPKCQRVNQYHLQGNTSHFVCACGGHQLSPKKDTIFEKSDTDLYKWFYALFLFSKSKNGVSGKEVQRQIQCTYKCAWRICFQIRTMFEEHNVTLSDIVETDETYVGGVGGNNKRGRGSENKTPVFGLLQRKERVIAKVTSDTKRKTVMPIIKEHVEIGTRMMTDEYLPYRSLPKEGYIHETVEHSAKEFVKYTDKEPIHVNSMEGFWSQLKRSINGTHHAVSPKHLQHYVDEFSWKYNHRAFPVFELLMAKVAKPSL
jgi:transposase-like protein